MSTDRFAVEALIPKFTDRTAVLTYAESAVAKLEQKWGKHLPEVAKWVADRTTRPTELLSRVASAADQLGVSAHERGTLVHRIAELRTLIRDPGKASNGTRLVEQSLQTADGHVELDLVTVKGNLHIIHDYKPIDLRQVLAKPWGDDFKAWLEQAHGGDYHKVASPRSMPQPLRQQYTAFLRHEVQTYIDDLDAKGYRSIYAAARGVPARRVRYSIIPYWTWNG